MKFKLLFQAFFILLPIFTESKRIAGGNEAARGLFPYHAILESSSEGVLRRLCGGALVKYNWILTAGQCIADARDAIVRLGVVDRLQTQQGLNFWIRDRSHLILHDNYEGDTENSIYKNDIGLVYIAEATENILGNYIRPVELPTTSASDELKYGYATGFGFYRDHENALQLMRLNYVGMQVISRDSCIQSHGSTVITNNHICTNTVGGLSTCIGDEGAPLVVIDGRYTLIAVGSTPLQICTQDYPAIFTDIVPYVDWIKEKIE